MKTILLSTCRLSAKSSSKFCGRELIGRNLIGCQWLSSDSTVSSTQILERNSDKTETLTSSETENVAKVSVDNDDFLSATMSLDTIFSTAGCGTNSSDMSSAVVPPIHFSTTFERDENLELRGFSYSRLGNPTRRLLESTFAKLEGGIEGFAFSSGMQSAFALLTACPKCHVLLPDDLFHGVHNLLSDVISKWGGTFEHIDMTNHSVLKEKLKQLGENKEGDEPKRVVVWLESPSNPKCRVFDIQKISMLAKSLIKQEQLCVVVDSTFATPNLQRPLELGADFSLHSMSKYIGGHSDMIGGMLVAGNTTGANMVLNTLRRVHQVGGGICSPFEAWLALRGLRTLPVRMKQHCENAMAVAEFLEGHPSVEKVFYPGLLSHPQHALAESQMNGKYGGMLSFQVKTENAGSVDEAFKVLKRVKLIKRATSLGGTESMLEHSASVDDERNNDEKSNAIPANLLRMSVGLEDIGDLLSDLDVALRNE